MNIDKAIGERIKNRRIELGMSQLDLAEKVGFSAKSSIAHIELGNKGIRQDRIIPMANALNVSVQWLMGMDEDVSDTKSALIEEISNLLSDFNPNEIAEIKKTIEYIKFKREN